MGLFEFFCGEWIRWRHQKYLLFTVHVYGRLMRIHWTFYIYFDQILTTFSKLKNMSEVVHNHWKRLEYLQILLRYLIATGCQKQLHRSNIQSCCLFYRILKEHVSSPPVFSGVRVTRSLILCVTSWQAEHLYACFTPLTLLLFDCPKQRLGFPTSYVVVFFMINELNWEVVVHFVVIGGIIDYHCSSFLFIKVPWRRKPEYPERTTDLS
jgi:hypothetical protein